MKISEKIDYFSAMALKEAQDKRAKVLPEIHREYLDACNKIELHAKEVYEKTIDDEAYKAEQMKNREILQANMEARRSLIELRIQLADELFDGVYEMLSDFVKTEEYAEMLVKNIGELAEQYPQGIEVSIRSLDAAHKEKISEISGVEITLGDDKMLGGFTAKVKGTNIFIDTSYRTKLEEERSEFNGFKITE